MTSHNIISVYVVDQLPYRRLTLVIIKVFEINANRRENYSPIKEINAKEGVTVQNEGN